MTGGARVRPGVDFVVNPNLSLPENEGGVGMFEEGEGGGEEEEGGDARDDESDVLKLVETHIVGSAEVPTPTPNLFRFIALHPMPYTLCPSPYVPCNAAYQLHPMPYTLCPSPYATCHAVYPLHPQLQPAACSLFA